jgi:hypothetical protein
MSSFIGALAIFVDRRSHENLSDGAYVGHESAWQDVAARQCMRAYAVEQVSDGRASYSVEDIHASPKCPLCGVFAPESALGKYR